MASNAATCSSSHSRPSIVIRRSRAATKRLRSSVGPSPLPRVVASAATRPTAWCARAPLRERRAAEFLLQPRVDFVPDQRDETPIVVELHRFVELLVLRLGPIDFHGKGPRLGKRGCDRDRQGPDPRIVGMQRPEYPHAGTPGLSSRHNRPCANGSDSAHSADNARTSASAIGPALRTFMGAYHGLRVASCISSRKAFVGRRGTHLEVPRANKPSAFVHAIALATSAGSSASQPRYQAMISP